MDLKNNLTIENRNIKEWYLLTTLFIMEKTKDHGPVAYQWGLIIGFSIGFLLHKYYPKDAAWWQDVLLGIGIPIVVFIAPIIWIPAPKKTEELDKEEEE